MRLTSFVARIAASLGVLALSFSASTSSFAAPIAPFPEVKIADSAISSPVGASADVATKLYWVTNRNEATLYGVNAQGETKRKVTYSAQVVSNEAVSVRRGKVYVGDIGDPQQNRASIAVYNPTTLTDGATSKVNQWSFTYPDGKHDAATMMVSPRGNIYIVTKGASATVYRSPASVDSMKTSQTYTLIKVASAPAWVTDGTFLDGDRVALRTYNSVFVLDAYKFDTLASGFLPIHDAGEALTTKIDSPSQLVAINKASGAELTIFDVPKTRQDVGTPPSAGPSASATATADPSASAASTTQPAADPSASDAPSGEATTAVDENDVDTSVDVNQVSPIRTAGTKIAIALAVLVSLIAGTFVFIKTSSGSQAPRRAARSLNESGADDEAKLGDKGERGSAKPSRRSVDPAGAAKRNK